MATLPKQICGFNLITIKIPKILSIDLEKAMLDLICSWKRPRRVKAMLMKKRNIGGITIVTNAIVTKTTWYWHKTRNIIQWNRRHK